MEMAAPAAVDAARIPRNIQTVTGTDGLDKWSIPLATTVNHIDPGSDGLILGTLGVGTAITLFTMAHAIFLNGGNKRRSGAAAGTKEHLTHGQFDRKKRSSSTDYHEAYAVYTSDNELEAPGIDAIYDSDSNWCGLRLTCELAAKAGRVLDEEERQMLSFFRGAISAEDLHTMATPQLYYSYASFIGFSSGDRAKCKKMYNKCPYPSSKMMDVYKMAAKKHSARRFIPDL